MPPRHNISIREDVITSEPIEVTADSELAVRKRERTVENNKGG